MENNSLMFEKMHPTRLFIKCAVPAVLSMLFSGIYSMADGIFVGRCIGSDALAAVNLVMPLIAIAFALAELIAVGSSVQLASLLGQKKNDDANRTFSVCVKVIIGISVVIGLVFGLLGRPMLSLMGAEGKVLEYSLQYIRVYALFSPLIIVYFAIDNYLRICGKQNLSMMLNITTAVLNIVLDFLFLVVFKWGVWAAALTSCVSISVGTVVAFYPFLRNKLELKFVKGAIPLRQFLQLVANGSSEFFANIAGSVFAFILNIVLLSIGGATAVAAMSVVMYAESLAAAVIIGTCESLQPAISYCQGAGLKKRVIALEKRILFSAAIFSFIACLFLHYGGGFIVPFFVKAGDTELLNLSIHAMGIYSLSYLVNWIDGCLSAFLTALGRAGRSFIVSVTGTLILPLISLAVLVPTLRFDGVCYMPLFVGVINGILALILVLTIKRKSGEGEINGNQTAQ